MSPADPAVQARLVSSQSRSMYALTASRCDRSVRGAGQHRHEAAIAMTTVFGGQAHSAMLTTRRAVTSGPITGRPACGSVRTAVSAGRSARQGMPMVLSMNRTAIIGPRMPARLWPGCDGGIRPENAAR